MRSVRVLLTFSLCLCLTAFAFAQKFATPVPYATGALAPNGVAVGDLNGDGHLDVVVANEDSPGTIAVLLGNGDGTLQAPVTYPANDWPGFVVLGDFNKDGHLDVAVANRAIGTPGQVLIFLGKGDGTLNSPTTYGPFTDAFSMAVGDVNHDGKLDIVLADTAAGILLLGNGDGTFGTGIPIGASDAVWFAIADFNGDHQPDLAVAYNSGQFVEIMLGNGHGTFTISTLLPVSTPPIALAAKDLNGDGVPDIAVADEAVNNLNSNVTVLLATVGGFSATKYPYGKEPRSIAIADFNHDGKPDIVTANEFDGKVRLFMNAGGGVFRTPLVFPIGAPTAVDLAVGDLNGDGKPDIVVTDGLNAVRVMLHQ